MKKRITLTIAALACFASIAVAAVSTDKASWAKGPVKFLMSKEEQTAWAALNTDADADAFVTAFWARRDPTPGTAANELRDEFDRRVAFADASYGAGRSGRGSLTDRGRVYVIFGRPTRVTKTPGAVAELPDRELWIYEGSFAEKVFDKPSVEVVFVDRFKQQDYRLDSPQRIDIPAAEARVVTNWMSAGAMAKPPAPAPVTPPAPSTTLTTASLEAAFADAKGGKFPSKDAVLTYAEFISPAGEYYVPVGLYVPASAGMAADAFDTFFGVIEDAEGKRVHVFERPASAMPSKNSLLYDTTLLLPSGKYTATLGLAKGGTPVLVNTAPLELKSIAKDAVGTSRLILADVMETLEAAPVKSPFAFGKLKIVPRTTFTNKDELGYFVELHNPGIDPTTNLPKLQAKVDLIKPSGPPISAPLSDVQALPLSGTVGPGEYALVSGIPLADLSKPLAPGDYTLRIKVVDTITKQSHTVEQKFRIH